MSLHSKRGKEGEGEGKREKREVRGEREKGKKMEREKTQQVCFLCAGNLLYAGTRGGLRLKGANVDLKGRKVGR